VKYYLPPNSDWKNCNNKAIILSIIANIELLVVPPVVSPTPVGAGDIIGIAVGLVVETVGTFIVTGVGVNAAVGTTVVGAGTVVATGTAVGTTVGAVPAATITVPLIKVCTLQW
jgi:hypothetical protein